MHKKSTCLITKQVPLNATGIELPPRQALPYPWQEKQGTLDSFLRGNEPIWLEHNHRCGMCCSGLHLGNLDLVIGHHVGIADGRGDVHLNPELSAPRS